MNKDVSLELAPEEEVVAIVRRGFFSQFPRWLFITVWILLPFFFFFPLLSFGAVGLLVFVALAASGILYALREWHLWYHTMWVVTDGRVIDIDQLSWTQREVHEVPLRLIKNVHVGRRAIWIESSTSHAYDIELEGVSRPKQLKQLLRDLKGIKKNA